MKRVAIVGASGFVGATVAETLFERDDVEVSALIHSSGNAWRLARRAIPLKVVDLLDRRQISAAVAECTHVVNCSRGSDDVMLRGLRNLLDESRKAGVAGFVHLSSVAVYGDPPPPESASEGAPANPTRGSYGWIKLQQDSMVQTAARSGLPAAILCPPNIGGPYSIYLLELLASLRVGEFALLEDGGGPCNLVDVGNLCHAIELALDRCSVESPRLFVTDDEPVTWGAVVDQLAPLVDSPLEPRSIGRDELMRISAEPVSPPASLKRSLLHLVSSDVREALRRDPLLAKADRALRHSVAALGGKVEHRLRVAVEGAVRVPKVSFSLPLNGRLCAQQLRDVRHSCDQARATLGYRPIHSFAQSMAAFRNWYRTHTGMDSPQEWSLLRCLY